MVKHRLVASGTGVLGDIDRLQEKMYGIAATRGVPKSFLDQYCRYNSSSFFFRQYELGVPAELICSDIRTASDDFVRRVVELCQIFGINLSKGEIEVENVKYFILCAYDLVHKALKLQTNFVWTMFFDEVRPAGKECLSIFPRKLHMRLDRMIRMRKTQQRRIKSCALINTLFQGWKKSLLGGFPSMVVNALKGHIQNLGIPQPPPSDEVLDRYERVCEMIEGEFHACFKETEIMDHFDMGIRATIESGRGKFGELGYASEMMESFEPDNLQRETILGYARPKHDHLGGGLPLPEEPLIAVGPVYEAMEYQNFFPERLIKNPRVRPCVIIEPNKARIITKPEIGTFAYMRHLQKKLWSRLFNHRSGFFRLIGEPLSREHLWELVIDWKVGEKICSGDFEATTDKLKKVIAKKMLRAVLGTKFMFKHPVLFQNIENTMLNNVVEFNSGAIPDDPLFHSKRFPELKEKYFRHEFGIKGPIFDQFIEYFQENGQVMGHVISFIILCLCNYGTYHVSWEIHRGVDLPLWAVPPLG